MLNAQGQSPKRGPQPRGFGFERYGPAGIVRDDVNPVFLIRHFRIRVRLPNASSEPRGSDDTDSPTGAASAPDEVRRQIARSSQRRVVRPLRARWSSEFCWAMESVAPDQIVRIPRACKRAGCWSAEAWTLIVAAAPRADVAAGAASARPGGPTGASDNESQSRGTPWINEKSAGRRSH